MRASPLVLRAGDIVRLRQERWTVIRHVPYGETTVIEVIGRDRTNDGQHARFVLPFESMARVTDLRTPQVVRPTRWRFEVRRILSAAQPSIHSLRATAGANLTILPFQLEPAIALVRGMACRLLLADEVGLGKTVQAGIIVAELLERISDMHVLIVAPAGLLGQWQAELQARFGLTGVIMDAAMLARGGQTPIVNPWAVQPLVIASIDFVKRPEVMRSLESLIWDLVLFDEAHLLSGASDRAGAASALAERARIVVLLSATPHPGEDSAFERLCDLGSLQGRFPLLLFRRTRRDAGIDVARRTTWMKVRPTTAEAEAHQALTSYTRLVWKEAGSSGRGARLAMAVLARRACSSMASLARSIERRLALLAEDGLSVDQLSLPFGEPAVDDNAPSMALMAPGLLDRQDERLRLAGLLALATRASHFESKLHAIRRLFRRTIEPAILFTEYRDTLAHVAAHLPDVDIVQLHGGLTSTERTTAIRRFTAGDARILLATDAAGEGLNLHQRCRLVVNLELPWTPLRLEQRIGRVDRLGQSRRVHALHLVSSRTSEETVVATLLRRMTRIGVALDALRVPDAQHDVVARAVLGGETVHVPGIRSDRALPPQVLVPDLRSTALTEAEHLLMARRLAADGRAGPQSSSPGFTDAAPRSAVSSVAEAMADPPNPSRIRPGHRSRSDGAKGRRTLASRPVIAILESRRQMRCWWAFRLEIANADGSILFEPLIALTADMVRQPPRRAADIRELFGAHHWMLTRVLVREHRRAIALAREALRAPLELGEDRERAILAVMTDRHARLAATLLQPGLFDRRSERAAASQKATIEEAGARCAERIRRLARGHTLQSGMRQFVFGAAIE